MSLIRLSAVHVGLLTVGLLLGSAENVRAKTEEANAPLKVGEEAPTFTLNILESDQKVNIADFHGEKPVVLFFGSYT